MSPGEKRGFETTELSWVIVGSDVWLSVTWSSEVGQALCDLAGLAYRRLICGKLRFMAGNPVRLGFKVAYQIKEIGLSC